MDFSAGCLHIHFSFNTFSSKTLSLRHASSVAIIERSSLIIAILLAVVFLTQKLPRRFWSGHPQ